MSDTINAPATNAVPAVVAISEAIGNKPTEYTRRKLDTTAFTVSDFEKAVEIMKGLQAKEETAVETIEAVGELEDKRLGHWLVKVVVSATIGFITIVVSTVGYATVTGADVSIPDYLVNAFSAVKDIAIAILDTKA